MFIIDIIKAFVDKRTLMRLVGDLPLLILSSLLLIPF